MFKKLAVTAALLAGFAGSTAVPAQAPHEGGRLEIMLEHLDLSDAQWLQVHKLMQQHRSAAVLLREREHQLHKALAMLDAASPNYAQQLQKLQDEAAQLARDRVQDFASIKNQIEDMLTPQQRAKLTEHVEAFGRRAPPAAG